MLDILNSIAGTFPIKQTNVAQIQKQTIINNSYRMNIFQLSFWSLRCFKWLVISHKNATTGKMPDVA